MNKLLQLIKNNGSKGQPLKIEQKGRTATVYLYDVIGADYYGGISAKELVPQIAALDVDQINLRINSPGGDVFDARAIAAAIQSHPAETIAHIDGLAASAATYVATAAAQVKMASGAFWMIHNAWTLAMGNANDLDETAALLRKIDASIRQDYSKKTGIGDEQLKAWMDKTTWFTAEEAAQQKFVDEIYDAETKPNAAWNLAAYGNAPAALAQKEETEGEIAEHKQRLKNRLELLLIQ